MKTQYIQCSSITYARKGHDILLKHGINSKITRPERLDVGCGYSLEVETFQVDKATKILRENGVKLSKKRNDMR